MWHYLWPHACYHITRLFPRYDRIRIRLILGVFSLILLAPQLIILLDNHSTRYCEQVLIEREGGDWPS